MLALPTGFEACDRTTVLGDTAAPTPLPHLQEREGLCVAKRTLRAVCALDSGELDSTAAVFDVLWKGVSATGRRRLIPTSKLFVEFLEIFFSQGFFGP